MYAMTYLQIGKIHESSPTLITNIMGLILFPRKLLRGWMPVLLFVLVICMRTTSPIAANNPLRQVHDVDTRHRK